MNSIQRASAAAIPGDSPFTAITRKPKSRDYGCAESGSVPERGLNERGNDMFEGLWERESDRSGAIQPGATNLTIFSTVIAGVAAGLVAFTDLSNKVIGSDATFGHDVLRVVLLVAIIAAGTLIIMADLFARSRVAAASERSAHLFAAPAGLEAKKKGTKAPFKVTQMRVDGDNGGSLQVQVDRGDGTSWYTIDDEEWKLAVNA